MRVCKYCQQEIKQRHNKCEYQLLQHRLAENPEAKEKARLASIERKRKYRERIGFDGRKLENQKQAHNKQKWHQAKKQDSQYLQSRREYGEHWRKSEEGKKYHREYYRNRRKTDPLFACITRLRSRLNMFLRKNSYHKPTQTEKLLGTNWEGFKKHFEKLFVDGMSWDNRDLWHIDHIVPLSSATTVEELEKLCHYTNLQPLWISDNLIKGNKIQPLSEHPNPNQ